MTGMYANAAADRDVYLRTIDPPLVLHPRDYADFIAADPGAHVAPSVVVPSRLDLIRPIARAFDVPMWMLLRPGPGVATVPDSASALLTEHRPAVRHLPLSDVQDLAWKATHP